MDAKVTRTGAANTIKGYDTAVNYFNAWRVHNNQVTLYVMAEEELNQKILFEGYAKYLKTEAMQVFHETEFLGMHLPEGIYIIITLPTWHTTNIQQRYM